MLFNGELVSSVKKRPEKQKGELAMFKTKQLFASALISLAAMVPLAAEAWWGFPFGGGPWDNGWGGGPWGGGPWGGPWGGYPGYGYGYPGYGYGYPGYGYGYPGFGYPAYGYQPYAYPFTAPSATSTDKK